MIGIVAASLLAIALAPPQQPSISTVQLPEGVKASGRLLADVNGDGNDDLVLACANEGRNLRELRIYFRQQSGPAFQSRPSETHQVDRDVIAFAFCDCRDEPGEELILLTAEAVVLVSAAPDGAPDYQRLARFDLVWPAADPAGVVPLPEASIDIDGDGRSDLVLPGPNSWSVLFQARDGDQVQFERRATRTLPPRNSGLSPDARGSGLQIGGRSMQLDFRSRPGEPRRAGALVSIAARTPKCQVVDLDADGRLDLVTQRNGRLLAARQGDPGTFVDIERELPLPEDRLKLIDPAFDVQFHDVNGDRRADLLLSTSTRRDDEVEARVDLYLATADGSWTNKPDSRLRMQPLAGPPRIVDVNGDGRPDLACLSVRTSSMRDFTGEAATSLDAQLTVFRNDGGKFVKPAMLARPLPLAAGESRLAPPFLVVRPQQNGKADVLLHVDGQLERRPLEPRGDRLRLRAADDRVAIPDGARLWIADADANAIMIVTDGEVQHVRLPR